MYVSRSHALRVQPTHLTSGTTKTESYTFEHEGYDIVLVDTPGFDDTTRSETQVLAEIATWLKITYAREPKIRLSGIIYLHSMLHNRMQGSALRNLRMFRELCGEQPLRNVVLATSFWNKVDVADGNRFEDELRTDNDFWAPMIARGAWMARFNGNRESALQIILTLVPRQPVTLEIQRELVDDSKELIDTAAGHAVNEELQRLTKKTQEEIARVRAETAEAMEQKDQEMEEVLRLQQENLDRQLDKISRDQALLKSQHRNDQREMELGWIAKLNRMESEHNAKLNRIESENYARFSRMQNESAEQLSRIESERVRDRDAWERRHERQRDEDQYRFDQLLTQIRANESKLREEDRRAVEQEIANARTQPKSGRTKSLMKGLLGLLGPITMGLLGLPMILSGNDPFSSFDGSGTVQ